LQLKNRNKNHKNSPKIAFKIASEIVSSALIKKAFLSTILLCLFFLAVPDHIKAQIASIISEDGDGIVGITSLMNATISGDSDAVKFFAKSGAVVVNQRNIGGASALHIAARMGNVEISTILIENGANVNITDNEGWTPLMRAVIAKNVELVKLLMKHGADPRQMNSVGETAIINSASAGCSECLEQLLSNYNFIDNLNIDILRKQLKDAIVIANNKNDLETQSIIKEYSNSELNKSPIYSLSKSSPNEAPIIPKTYNGDGIVNVKSLNDMPEGKSSIYRFTAVKKDEPFPSSSSSKIPQKTFYIVNRSSDSNSMANEANERVPDKQKFVFKVGKKPHTPIVDNNTKHTSDFETGIATSYKETYLLKTTTDDAAISNSATKKFIFKVGKKSYVPTPTKENILNPKKKTDIYNFKKDDSANTPKTAEAVSDTIHPEPTNSETTDKKFIFKGSSKPSPNKNSVNILKNSLEKLEKVVVDDTKTEEKIINAIDSQPSVDKKFIFKGNK
jgi:uncharacterized protein